MLSSIPTSSEITAEVRKAYTSSRLTVTRRIAIYEADGTTLWRPESFQERLISGSISVDFDRDERRSIDSLVLYNKDGLLNQDPDGFWYDKIIKVYRGLIYFDSENVQRRFEIQIGEFMIDTISDARFPKSVSVNGRDYTKKLLLDQFSVDTSFPSGISLDVLVRTIALNGGISKFRLGATGATLGSAPTFARKTSRWEAIKSVCNGLNVEVYFDREGYLVTRFFDDVSTSAPSFELTMEAGKQNIVDFSKATSDSNIFNHIVVIGTSEEETVTGYKFISILENTDPDSPTCIQKIGRRTFTYEVSYITSQAQADDLALRLMKIKQLEDFALSFSTVCLPWLEPGRVLGFRDPFSSDSIPTRFLFSTFSIPLELGPLSGEGKRIAIIGVPESQQGGIDLNADEGT